MRTYRLLMPAATLAGALALAGCGGGDNKPAPDPKKEDPKTMPAKPACADPGVKPNADGSDCVPDTSAADAAADEANAKALYGVIKPVYNGSASPPEREEPSGRSNFKKATATVAALGDWNGQHYTRTDSKGKVTGELRAYSSAEMELVDFAKVYSLVTSAGPNKGHLMIPSSSSANVPYAKIGGLGLSGGGKTAPLTGDGRKISGTYDGANGQYICTGDTTCDVTTDKDGKVTALAGTWHFDPATGAQAPKTEDGFEFGWWIAKDGDGDVMSATAFASNTAGADPKMLFPTSATATYKGHAAGKYAVQKAGSNPAHSGHFTATAELEATFSDTTSKIEGTVDGFRLNDGTSDPGWKVTLKENAADHSSGDFTGKTVWAIDGVEDGEGGDWNAELHGTVKGTADTPNHAIGDFGAKYQSFGHMVGAFGTEHSAD